MVVCVFASNAACSVHGPSESKVAGKISSVVPVGPPVEHSAEVGLPEGVFHDTEMVRPAICLSVVEGEADAVGLWAIAQSCVKFFLRNVFLHVPPSDFVCSCVHRWDSILGWGNRRLLVRVFAISELENFAN